MSAISAHAEAERALYQTLLGNALISGAVGQRVYNQFAPQGTTATHVVFLFNSGADSNEQQVRMVDLRYTVKVVSQDPTTAMKVAASIDAALHEQALDIASPYAVMRCQRISIFKYHEIIDRAAYHHQGGIYRIRISEE